MEISVKELLLLQLRTVKGKIPKDIEFNKDDLIILDKFKDNIDLIRNKIDELDLNFILSLL
jgi:methionyl-tRNA synthetase